MTEQQKQIKRDFINFLKVRRLYSKFKRNIKADNTQPICKSRVNYIRPNIYISNKIKNNPEMLVQGAFGWGYTHESHDFWYTISTQWKAFYKKHYSM